MSALEATYLVEFDDGTIAEMILPVSVEIGTRLGVEMSFELAEEPPTIPQPMSVSAVLQHHWWQAKTKPVRVGPSVEHWDLHIRWRADKPLMNFILRDNPIEKASVSAVFQWCKDHAWMTKGKQVEYIPPGKPGNPTKATPAYVKMVDSGKLRIYESSDVFFKFDIRMKTWKNHYVFVRRDPRLNLWELRKEEEKPETK